MAMQDVPPAFAPATRRNPARAHANARRPTLMSDDQPATASLAAEINARRCAFCGCDRAQFGCGPPLTHISFWVCRDHRPHAEASVLSGIPPQPLTPTPGA
jgi:hypothetical protein